MPTLNFLLYEVPIHLHMRSPIMLDQVVSNTDSILIVTMDGCWVLQALIVAP